MSRYDQKEGFEQVSRDNSNEAIGLNQPGQYSYKITMQGRGEGRMAWDVTEKSDNEFAVGFHYELGEEVYDTTVTGGSDELRDELLATPAYPFLSVAFYPSISLFANENELTVGDQISFPMEGGTGQVEIIDTPVQAGSKCYTSVWRYNGNLRYRDCIAPDREIVFYAVSYTKEDAAPLLKIELLENQSAIDDTE